MGDSGNIDWASCFDPQAGDVDGLEAPAAGLSSPVEDCKEAGLLAKLVVEGGL